MYKIDFDDLSVEVTRRCNLSCPHCMRGEAQEKDILPDTIDKLLDRTNKIDTLLFTGGEPTLNISAMRYFLDGLKEREIPLCLLIISTNGLIQTNDVITVLRDYSDYINMCNNKPGKKISFGVSSDKYHATDGDALVKFWINAIGDFAAVYKKTTGMLPNKEGRAKQLKHGVREIFFPHAKIAYLSPEKPDFICEQGEHYSPQQNILRLPDALFMSYDGMFFDNSWNEYDSFVVKNCIFTLDTEDIVKTIESYNTGKPYRRIAKEAMESNYNVAQWIKQTGIYGLQLSVNDASEQAKALKELVSPEHKKTDSEKERAFIRQYENSTDDDIINTIYQTSFGNKSPEKLTENDFKAVNNIYADLYNKYRRIKKNDNI